MRRALSLLVTASLWLMTYGSLAAPVRVHVVLSQPGGVYAEAADALRAEVERVRPGQVEWQVNANWRPWRGPLAPNWVVAVGMDAYRKTQLALSGEPKPPPLLAVLVPQKAFSQIAEPWRLSAGLLSAAFIDQPAPRQLELARLAIPSLRKLGILFGPSSQSLEGEFRAAAREMGIELRTSKVEIDRLPAALQSVLPDVGALLAIADPSVYNSETAAYILDGAYRQRVPLIGFSPAYARAGALVSLYSTPKQIGRRGGEMLLQALSQGQLPPPLPPREFEISVNHDVARSLGIPLSEDQLARLVRQRGAP